MNREIKFRAKPLKGGYPWVYGNAVLQVKGKAYLLEDNEAEVIPDFDRESSFYTVDGLIEVDTKTIGQYTGLKDKKGKEIYEGDILEYIGKRKDNMNKVYRRKSVFHEGMFALLSKELPAYSALNYHCMEDGRSAWRVIGNTYDNPEMMEGAV